MIEVQNVTKRYGEILAVSHVSFNVAEGQVVGFLGPNGAGKTTTMKMLTGFMPATEGRLQVAGFDVFDQPMEVKRRIGYLPEQPPLYPDMTVESFLRFAAALRDVSPREIPAAVGRAVDAAGLREVSHRIIGHLSKGFRQRVGVAQALVHDPPVLILDEPTVGLDPVQIREIRDLIARLAGERTVILSTHILPEVSMLCERVIIIHKGRIVADGTEEDLWHGLSGVGHTIVSVKGPSDDVRAEVCSLASVAAAKVDGVDAGVARLTVEAAEGADPRDDISLALAQKGWAVMEMRPPGLTLEEVFIRLTTQENEGGEGRENVADLSS